VHKPTGAQAALAIPKTNHRGGEARKRKNKKGFKYLKEFSP
jgi:hypothetical protein